MNLGKISAYRGELMGFAILIVMLFHMGVPRSSSWYGLVRMGNLGVDIFLFLSGMGLWYSWSKNPALRQFYFNRVIRIYPAWLIIAGYYFISRFDFAHATVDSWINLVMQVLFNWNFWRFDQLTFWYVPATMMLYVFAPFYMEAVRRNPACRWLVVFPLMWCIMVTYITPIHNAVGHIEIFWSRVPIFFLGINLAESIRNKTTLPASTWVMVVAAFVVSLGACVWLEQMRHGRFPLYTERMLYIVLAVTTVIIMSEVFDRLRSVKFVNAAFAFVGGISLEIYLLHVEYVLRPLQKAYNLPYWPRFLVVLAISVPLAWIISKVCSIIINRLKTLTVNR